MWKRVVNGVRSRVTRFRVPGGAAVSGGEREPGEPGYDDRPMPIPASILWRPVEGAGEYGLAMPIFITQRALAAVDDHAATTPETCFGLLIGKLFRSPETGAPYIVVESTIRLPRGARDDAKAALVQGWVVAQDVLRRTGDQLVGWYRGSHSTDVWLTPAEADTHEALFGQPWQIALAAGLGDVAVGGVFRRSASSEWARRCLPFYELVDPTFVPSDGAKPTRLGWTNYRSAELTLVRPLATALPDPTPVVEPTPTVAPPIPAPTPTLVHAPASRAPSRLPPRVLMPDQFGREQGANPVSGWAVRVVAYAAVGILAVVGLFRLYSALASPASPASPGPSAAAPKAAMAVPLERLDRAADTLALAIAAFDLRARLFASRQMQCSELARGLVLVEEQWTRYNIERKDGGVPRDSARTARDRSLYTDADGVEQRFERSSCPRP